MIGQTISHYKIKEKLGEGGMGVVYLAEDNNLKRAVALKFLPQSTSSDPERKKRLVREAQAAAALRHPGICTVHEVDEIDGRTFIVMEHIEGRSLRERIAVGPMGLEEAVQITIQVAEALEEAHKKGIVHRDIKPENVMLTKEGHAVVMDFGLAKSLEAAAITKTGMTLGTAAYMSPEQAQGGQIDHRTDIWSLGVMLYEMLAGRPPFESELAHALIYLIVSVDPVPLKQVCTDVPDELDRIVAKTLAKDPKERHDSAAELAEELKALQDIPAGRAIRHPLRRPVIPVALGLLLAIVILLLVNPFKRGIAPDRETGEDKNVVAIMYFDNLAQEGDPRRLGEIFTNLLITSLSQSHDLEVVSSQRLYDILKLQGKEGTKVIDRTTATEIATAAGAGWMMLGSILQVYPNLVVTTQLVDVATGSVEASQRLTGAAGETVFDLVDRMTGKARTELAGPVRLDVGQLPPVMDVTTSSLDAYRYYLEGLDYRYKYYNKEAAESFLKALEYDSTFAMAHYWYSKSAFLTVGYKAGAAALDKAVRYAGRTSEKERLYIEAQKARTDDREDEAINKLEQIAESYLDEKEALLQLANIYDDRDSGKSLEYYQKVLAIDPLDKRTYNSLAALHNDMGDFEKSVWAIERYIELSPGEANPYDTRGDLYAHNGDVKNAIASYKKALEIKPDFFHSLCKLGNMYVFNGQYEKARAEYQVLIAGDVPAFRARGRLYLSTIELYQGKLRDALETLDTGVAADEMENYRGDWYVHKFFERARVRTLLEQYDQSQEDIRRGLALIKPLFPKDSQSFDIAFAPSWVLNGRVEEAADIIAPFEAVLDTLNSSGLGHYYFARGFIALDRGDLEDACHHLEMADSSFPKQYEKRYWLATAYLRSGRVDEAIAKLEAALELHDWTRLWFPELAARGYYLLGTAYQKAGEKQKAVENLRKFVDIWKDADSELQKEVADARSRMQLLGEGG